MGRREFLTGLVSVAGAWPLTGRAQSAKPLIGYLALAPLAIIEQRLAAFRKGLEPYGFVEGRTCIIEFRSAEGRPERLPSLAADLMRSGAHVIASNGAVGAIAVKRLSNSIPVVVVAAGDLVQLGLVKSLNRPGGNVTGVSYLTGQLDSKRLSLLHEVAPSAGRIVVLNWRDVSSGQQSPAIEEAGRKLNLRLRIARPATLAELDAALDDVAVGNSEALVVGPGPLFDTRRKRIVGLVAMKSWPAIYPARQFVEIGGLMSYGTDVSAAYRIAGEYTARILKGEQPADLPVQQSTRFELVLNLKTARALGLEFPATLLAIADEVIE